MEKYVYGKIRQSIVETEKVNNMLLRQRLTWELEHNGVLRFSAKLTNAILSEYAKRTNPIDDVDFDDNLPVCDELINSLNHATSSSNKERTAEPLLQLLMHGEGLNVKEIVGTVITVSQAKHIGTALQDTILLELVRHISHNHLERSCEGVIEAIRHDVDRVILGQFNRVTKKGLGWDSWVE